jgi:hypothetical protein
MAAQVQLYMQRMRDWTKSEHITPRIKQMILVSTSPFFCVHHVTYQLHRVSSSYSLADGKCQLRSGNGNVQPSNSTSSWYVLKSNSYEVVGVDRCCFSGGSRVQGRAGRYRRPRSVWKWRKCNSESPRWYAEATTPCPRRLQRFGSDRGMIRCDTFWLKRMIAWVAVGQTLSHNTSFVVVFAFAFRFLYAPRCITGLDSSGLYHGHVAGGSIGYLRTSNDARTG